MLPASSSLHWVTIQTHHEQIPQSACDALTKLNPQAAGSAQLCQATSTISVALPAGTTTPYVLGGGPGGSCGDIYVPWTQTYTLSTLYSGYHVEHSGTFEYTGCAAYDSGHVCNRNMAFRFSITGLSSTGCRDNTSGSSQVDAEADYIVYIPGGGFTKRLDATCTATGSISDLSITAD